MKTSNKGLQLIRDFEGCVLTAYKCPAGVWTIGYGHTRGVKPGDKISRSLAEDYLLSDVRSVERQLNTLLPELEQQQFDALVSFVFNLGWTKFTSSTLLKRIQAHSGDQAVCEQLLRWVYSGKTPLPGLMRRRVAEANMWMGAPVYKFVMIDGEGKIIKV